jgi:hypothetical protein
LASHQSSIADYTNGVRLVGVIARAIVSIGQAATDKPIPIDVVNFADCRSRFPQCSASRVSAVDYRIGGDMLSKGGFSAVVGVSMGNGDAVNPLAHIGAHSWIVVLPRPGDAQPGTLIVNPDSDDRTGYTPFPTDESMRRSPGGRHDVIAGCLASADPPKRICGPTMLDTGTSGIYIQPANVVNLSGWKAGLGMEIAFKNKSGAGISTKFAAEGVGRPLIQWSGGPSWISTIHEPNLRRTVILAGALPYFNFSVLYDADKGVIGLKRR